MKSYVLCCSTARMLPWLLWVWDGSGDSLALLGPLQVSFLWRTNCAQTELKSTSESQRWEKANPTPAEVGKWQEEAKLRFSMEDRTVRYMWKGQLSYTGWRKTQSPPWLECQGSELCQHRQEAEEWCGQGCGICSEKSCERTWEDMTGGTGGGSWRH